MQSPRFMARCRYEARPRRVSLGHVNFVLAGVYKNPDERKRQADLMCKRPRRVVHVIDDVEYFMEASQ